jgi:DNA-binding PadR family transcriptional regulator
MAHFTLNKTLTTQAFYALLAIAERPLHGYGIMEQIAVDSESRLILAPGTVYGILNRLEKDGLVKKFIPASLLVASSLSRYEITTAGKNALKSEMARMERAVLDARRRLGLYSIYD